MTALNGPEMMNSSMDVTTATRDAALGPFLAAAITIGSGNSAPKYASRRNSVERWKRRPVSAESIAHSTSTGTGSSSGRPLSSPDEVSRIGGGGAPSANERGAGATTRPPLVLRSWSLGGMGHRAVDAPIPARRHRRWTRGGEARCEDADVLAAEADATLAQRPTVDHDVAMLRRATTSVTWGGVGAPRLTGRHTVSL